jgi:membrane protein
LFEAGKTAIGLYLGKSGVTESYAAAGSLVVLLAWVYYAAQIFLLGAEFTKIYADEHGSLVGAKAVAATQVAAAQAEAGTDRVVPAAGATVRSTDGSADEETVLARTADAQREVDRRMQAATATLARKAVLLAAVTVVNAVVEHWNRQQRKLARRNASAGRRATARSRSR